MSGVERTLVLIKPDGTMRRYIGTKILEELTDQKDLKILAFKELRVSKELAEKHYAVHKDKPFFNGLVEFIKVGPAIAMIIEGVDAIQRTRGLFGNTFSHKADLHTIRGKYGIWGGINVVHASDAPKTASYEIELWRNITGLAVEDSKLVKERIKEYTSKWGLDKKDYTSELREICRKIVNTKSRIEHFKREMVELLKKECLDSSSKDVEALVNAIVVSILT
ncbi:MAG: nucleoside-diphosphate kinase [Candidatus Hodarchaeota archaeon]